MKKAFIVFILIGTLILSGCGNRAKEYPFRQPVDQIESISIIQWPSWEPEYYLVKELTPKEAESITRDLLQLEAKRQSFLPLDPQVDFGSYIIRIAYSDGEIEMIGYTNNGGTDVNGEDWRGHICFDCEAFLELIDEYIRPRFRENG